MEPSVLGTSLFISFLWGASPVIQRFLMSTRPLSPETLMVFGSAIYFLCTAIYFAFNRRKILSELSIVSWKTLSIMIVSGVFVGFVANYLYYKVIRNNTSYIVAALVFSAPFFTVILSYLFLKEELTFLSGLGVFLIVAGIILLASSNIRPTNIEFIRAD
jgi:drug/metabolite transporter (DMT)-like permease